MTNIRHLLACNLKAYRHALGWSQAKLAEKVNTSAHYIGMIETENKFPSPEMIERLAAALGIDSSELFYKEIDPSEIVKTFRKAALTDIGVMVGQFISEKLQDLNGEK